MVNNLHLFALLIQAANGTRWLAHQTQLNNHTLAMMEVIPSGMRIIAISNAHHKLHSFLRNSATQLKFTT
jgi:hypothetical protein